MTKGFFITGTDTDVGKSYFGAQLVQQLYKQGKAVQPRKPIESGCQQQNGTLLPSDGLAYHEATDKNISLDLITPFRFTPAVAPPQAMSADNAVYLKQIKAAVYKDLSDELLIVEGAGGFYSPLCMDASNADLACELNLPIILLVGNKVGCINHCLLTVEAIINKQLSIAAIVLNDLQDQHELLAENYQSIQSLVAEYDATLADKTLYIAHKSHIHDQIEQILVSNHIF